LKPALVTDYRRNRPLVPSGHCPSVCLALLFGKAPVPQPRAG